MSLPRKPPREHWRTFSSGPKAAPPARGIKIRTVGTTWWGAQWIGALERISPDYASRLARGKTYARGGRVHDLVVASGQVTARVTGSRPQPYDVTITLPPLTAESWQQAIATLSVRARFAAELLAGVMPKDVDEAFRAAGASLFPGQAGDLVTTCSCPDWANPCKHVAATHYVLGDAFDRDPFLLFELRGRTREEVLARTKEARRATGSGPKKKRVTPSSDVPTGVTFADVPPDAYDAWTAPPPVLSLTFTGPARPAAALASLGLPGSWREKASPQQLLGPLVQDASTLARDAARGSPGPDDGSEGSQGSM